jgi:hypothetical protein
MGSEFRALRGRHFGESPATRERQANGSLITRRALRRLRVRIQSQLIAMLSWLPDSYKTVMTDGVYEERLEIKRLTFDRQPLPEPKEARQSRHHDKTLLDFAQS